MKKLLVVSTIALIYLLLTLSAYSQQFSNTGKKLIETGWDIREPAFLKANSAKMEQYPFDGLIFRLENYNQAFDTNPWPEDKLKPMEADVKAIKWRKFKSNFMLLYAANDSGMNWFDDAQWKTILGNARKYSRIARSGKCAGIIVDPEAYGKDPWIFPGDYPNKTFDEVTAQVRLRGKQWMQALQQNWPNMHLLLYYFDPSQSENKGYTFGAFCNGLLEGAGPNVKIINGNEGSYYHTDSQSYVNDWQNMRVKALTKIDPKLKSKYDKIVQAGMALYMDQSLALRPPMGQYISYYMTPEDRLKYFEHSVYWAMKTADEYVWCYSERLNWWDAAFPKGADDAIRTARKKLETGEGLGFTLDQRVQYASRNRAEALAMQMQKLSETISRIPQDVSAPNIDGKLDDTIWQKTKPLAAFVPSAPTVISGGTISAQTTARVTFDDTNIYLAIKCWEPNMDQLAIVGETKDSNVWAGDILEMFVSTESGTPYNYRHFMVNPNNVQWDGAAPPASNDVNWNADWKSAVIKNSDSWTIEVAIPWSAVGGKPASDTARYANICRQRSGREFSSWSSVFEGFLDPATFGQWVFKN
jgi:hypothetical protein